jgi:hypothetical protein
MGTLFAALMLAAQDLETLRAAELARDLSHDLIEVRERAQAELSKLGAAAYPAIRRALYGADAEARVRAATILRFPAFLGVPEVVEANIKSLGVEEGERWIKAAEDLLTAGAPAVPALRKAAESKEQRLAFRARQIAAILESPPVRGLKFGILVETAEVELRGPVPGWDVLVNVSSEPLRFEGNRQSWVYPFPLEPVSCCLGGSLFG